MLGTLRDREEPHGSSPPTPPYERITYTAVRQIRSEDKSSKRDASTGASSLTAPTTGSSHKGLRPTDAIPSFLGNRVLLSFNLLAGNRSGLRPSLQPTMPSADFCFAVSANFSALSQFLSHARSRGAKQISQGKTQNCARVDAEFIKHVPNGRMEDFAVTCPLVPNVPHLRSGSCTSPRAFGLSFLQTPPHDDALALLLVFGSSYT